MKKPFLLVSTCLIGGMGYQYMKSSNNQKDQLFLKNSFIDKNTALANQNKEIFYKLKDRNQHLDQIITKDQYDIIVIGGGCNGAGVFLDACARGLSCVLLESNDFASQTSSKSTKLIHGGVRYLQQVFELSLEGGRMQKFNLVKEALKERAVFVDNAFYMNKQLPIIIPSDNLFEALFYYTGSMINQGASPRFQMPYIIGKQQLNKHFEHIDDNYNYGVVYYDGQFNDTRMNLDILFTGTLLNQNQQGGNILNYAKVDSIIKNNSGAAVGVSFTDNISKKQHKINAKIIVNCTGVFADTIRKLDDPQCNQRIIPVGGSHLIMARQYFNKKYGLLIPKTNDGRVLFLLPWLDHSIVGTTETRYKLPTENPQVKFEEMRFMVEETCNLFSKLSVPQISNSIKTKWSGLRPLILEEGLDASDPYIDTKKVARNHVIEVSKTGMISLLGGKWTVYRKMGEETVDKAIELMKIRNLISSEQAAKLLSTHPTANLRLLGSLNKDPQFQLPTRRQYIRFYAQQLKNKYDLDLSICKNLIKSYGDRAFDLMKLVDEDPSLIQKVHPDHKILKAEIIYQIRFEMSQSPLDNIYRRTRLGFLDRQATLDSVQTIVDLYAKELNWDKRYTKNQLNKVNKQIETLSF